MMLVKGFILFVALKLYFEIAGKKALPVFFERSKKVNAGNDRY
jgi:hypothetical protein